MTAFPSDADLLAAGWIKASRRHRRIISRPRVGQVYWIDFPHDVYPPEFMGEHPGIIIRAAQNLHGTCIIVPVTSKSQSDASHTHTLTVNPIPSVRQNLIQSHVVCDHLYTVHVNRLRPIIAKHNRPIYPKISAHDLQIIVSKIQSALFSNRV